VALALQPQSIALDSRETATKVPSTIRSVRCGACMRVHSVQKPEIPSLEMPARFRTDIAYFMTPAGDKGAPHLGAGEYWVRLEDARRWLADGMLEVVSPLDAESKAEIELTEDHERWLEWLVQHEIEHLRLET